MSSIKTNGNNLCSPNPCKQIYSTKCRHCVHAHVRMHVHMLLSEFHLMLVCHFFFFFFFSLCFFIVGFPPTTTFLIHITHYNTIPRNSQKNNHAFNTNQYIKYTTLALHRCATRATRFPVRSMSIQEYSETFTLHACTCYVISIFLRNYKKCCPLTTV